MGQCSSMLPALVALEPQVNGSNFTNNSSSKKCSSANNDKTCSPTTSSKKQGQKVSLLRRRDSASTPLNQYDLLDASIHSFTHGTSTTAAYSTRDPGTSRGDLYDPLPDELRASAVTPGSKEKPEPTTDPSTSTNRGALDGPLPHELRTSTVASAAKEEPEPNQASTEPAPATKRASKRESSKRRTPRRLSENPVTKRTSKRESTKERTSCRLSEKPRSRASVRSSARAQQSTAADDANPSSSLSSATTSQRLMTKQKSERQSLLVGDLSKSKLGCGKDSSWYAMSCTSKDSLQYDSYKHSSRDNAASALLSFLQQSQGHFPDEKFSLEETPENAAATTTTTGYDLMRLSRMEKDALTMHGICFTESEQEDDDESDLDDDNAL